MLCSVEASLKTVYHEIGEKVTINKDSFIVCAGRHKRRKEGMPHRHVWKFEKMDFFGSGSTDMGDLSCIIPVVQPYAGGAAGMPHGSDYEIKDPIAACVGSAKLQLAMLHLLLSNGANEAKRIINEFKPVFATKEEYFRFVDALNCSGERIHYSDGNIITVNVQ